MNFVENKELSQQIALFRLVAILSVILVHIPYDYSISVLSEGFHAYTQAFAHAPLRDKVIIFFQHGLGRVSSPALSIVSAWFLMAAMNQSSTKDLFKKKIQTLIIPYYVWGAITVILFCAAQMAVDDIESAQDIIVTALKKTVSPGYWPTNYALHFLFDIFIIMTFFLVFFRTQVKNTGLMVIIALVGPIILTVWGDSESWLGANEVSPLPRVDLFVYFFLGIATYGKINVIFSEKSLHFFTRPAVIFSLLGGAVLSSVFLYYYNKVLGPDLNIKSLILLYLSLANRLLLTTFLFSLTIFLGKIWKFTPPKRLAFRLFCTYIIIIYFTAKGLSYLNLPPEINYVTLLALILILGGIFNAALECINRRYNVPVLRYL